MKKPIATIEYATGSGYMKRPVYGTRDIVGRTCSQIWWIEQPDEELFRAAEAALKTTGGSQWFHASPVRTPPLPARIVCAALKLTSGALILGPRHYDTTMRQALKDYTAADMLNAEQGFIDAAGAFLTREKAWVVANATGQIIRRCGGDEGRLYSENLY